MDFLTPAKEHFQKSIQHLSSELASVRTGRASTALVEEMMIESYGAQVQLRTIANISTPDASTILIQPWDQANIKDIEKAITEANIGLTPQNNGNSVLLNIPALTEETRKNIVKTIHQLAENSRVAIRSTREDTKNKIRAAEKAKEISEDEMRENEGNLQELVDQYQAEIEAMIKEKEKEIMTI